MHEPEKGKRIMSFEKILIANRGEIAIRVMRTCREIGIKSVAVFSTEDRKSLFYRLANESYLLKGTEIQDTYLNIEKMIYIAKKTGCGAIHPGYGFLSENPTFVDACESAGVKFIGPKSATMKKVGDKARIKKIMEAAGIPVLPSFENPDDTEELADIVRRIGFPLIIKPTFGGGGKGMKIVYSEPELVPAIQFAQNMGRTAFGNPAFYVEKYLENSRHIEVQILADGQGQIVDLGERDCSIQRRHQKLIEESPSPALNRELRRQVADLARRAAQAVEYENAGTIEFLFEDGKFYFLEVNARIQVEHPVTELVTGIDLIKEQIKIAAGEPIKISKKRTVPNGWAIECRINAEDPESNFMPSPGQITGYRSPGGIGVRVDSGVFMGFSIPPQYDSLISKLTVWGRNRNEATARMRRALDEYVILGIKNTLPLYRAIFREKEFLKGKHATSYIDKHLQGLLQDVEQHTNKFQERMLTSIFHNDRGMPVCDAYLVNEEFPVFYT